VPGKRVPAIAKANLAVAKAAMDPPNLSIGIAG
jgi:hypothetical protein